MFTNPFKSSLESRNLLRFSDDKLLNLTEITDGQEATSRAVRDYNIVGSNFYFLKLLKKFPKPDAIAIITRWHCPTRAADEY